MAGVDEARASLCSWLGCQATELVFTSGATEANNLALFGLVKPGDHLITTAIEHPSVLEPARELERRGCEVTLASPNRSGVVATAAVVEAVRPNTRLISVMYVNNELGTIQPVVEISQQLAKKNYERKKQGLPAVLLHTDAVQAARHLPLHLDQLGVDILSLSAHKIYGPKGVGLLYVSQGIRLKPLLFGGAQQTAVRPGTFAVPQIVGFGKAASLVTTAEHQSDLHRLKKMAMSLSRSLAGIRGVTLNCEKANRVDGILSLTVAGQDAQSLLILLDQAGVAISAGAACSSGSLEPSHVLKAIGLSKKAAQATIRGSFGRFTTLADINKFVHCLRRVLSRSA